MNKPPWYAHLVLGTLAACFAAPLAWLLLASFKTPEQMLAEPYAWWPDPWRPANYRDALTSMPYLTYLRNSLVLCVGCVLGTLAACAPAAYAFARLRFPGRDVLFGLLVVTMLLPWHVTMIPRFVLLRCLGLYDTPWAIILPTFLGDAFFIFLLRQFFRAIPEELSEAARLDGCSEPGIFWRIVLPLARPALATVALWQFVATWNDFSSPLLLLNDPRRLPLAYGLEQFTSSYSSQTHLLLAAAAMFTLPVVIVFLLAQRAFIAGLATSGIKG
ncbi:MAG: carbohydrate ABC transporter permease [Pirellulales bacterium]|nr:carbohydrate ABC transporter permease [Pirellulales bacterium]